MNQGALYGDCLDLLFLSKSKLEGPPLYHNGMTEQWLSSMKIGGFAARLSMVFQGK